MLLLLERRVLSSSVSIGSFISSLICLCTALSFISLSSGTKYSNVCFAVLSVSKVKVPSGYWRVVKQVVLLNLPEAVL